MFVYSNEIYEQNAQRQNVHIRAGPEKTVISTGDLTEKAFRG